MVVKKIGDECIPEDETDETALPLAWKNCMIPFFIWVHSVPVVNNVDLHSYPETGNF